MKRLFLIGPALLAGAANSVAAGLTADGGLYAAIGAVVTTVGLTLAVVAWIDRRIDHKIRNHANVERYQFKTLLREISGLRELMGHPPLDVKLLANSEGE